MNKRERQELDWHITGIFGEDQLDNEEEKFSPIQGIVISVLLGLALYGLAFLAFL